MKPFTHQLIALLGFIYLFLSTSQVYAQTPVDGLYIGISATKAGQTPIHPVADRATAYNRAIPLAANTTTYILQQGSGNYTISGDISGAGDLVIDIGSTDTLILTGANAISGSLTIKSGSILQIGDGTATGAIGSGAIVNNGTLIYNRSDQVTWANAISGTGALIRKSSGTLTLTGTNTYSGKTTIMAGIMGIQATNALSPNTAVEVRSGAFLYYNTRRGNATWANVISGAGTIGHKGTDTLTLTGANIYTGTTTIIGGGELRIGEGGSLGKGTGNVDYDATFSGIATLLYSSSKDDTLSGAITGNIQLIKEASSTLTLTNAGNTFTGATHVKEGTLVLGSGASNSASPVTVYKGASLCGAGTVSDVTLEEGAFFYGGTATAPGTLTTGNITSHGGIVKVHRNTTTTSTIAAGTNDVSGTLYIYLENQMSSNATATTVVTNTGTSTDPIPLLAKNASGQRAKTNWVDGTGIQITVGDAHAGEAGLYYNTTRITSSTADITLSANTEFTEIVASPNISHKLSGVIDDGANTYNVTFSVDTLTLSNDNTYGGTTTVNGFLQVGDGAGSGSLGGGSITLNQGASLTYNRNDKYTVSNVISGAGKLIQAGSDTMVLTGANTHSGKKEIRSGALQMGSGAGAGDIGTGEVSIAAGASLIYDRSDDVEWPSTLSISGTGSIVKKGTGVLTLSATPTDYSGAVTVETDTLKIENWTASAMTVKRGATLELAGTDDEYHNFPLTLEDGSTLHKSNTRTNGFSDHDVIVDGAVKIEITNSPTSDGYELYIGDLNSGGVGIRGSGTLTIDNRGGKEYAGLILQSTNPDHFNGKIIVQNGRLYISSFASLALDSTVLRLEDKAKFFTGHNPSVKALEGEGNTEVHVENNQTLTIGTDNGSGSYAGEIRNSAYKPNESTRHVKKVGTGTQTLTGTNTYMGATRVEDGILEIGSGGSLSAGSTVTIDGGTLRGVGTVNGSVTLSGSSGSTLYGGSGSGNTGNLTIGGTLTGEGGTLDVYASGSAVSTVTAGKVTGRLAVNFKEAISLGGSQTLTRTLITCTDVNSSLKPYIGVNSSGHGVRFLWTSGTGFTGLRVILGGTAGLYKDNVIVSNLSEAIALIQTSTFSEVVETAKVTYELSGIISGMGHGITTQVDSLILTGKNTYTGKTKVSSGVLQIGKGGTDGSIHGTADTITVGPGAVLQFQRSDDIIVANVIDGSGTLVQGGAGTLILTGANTHSGKKEIRFGSLQVGNGGRPGDIGTGEVSIASGASLIYNRSDAVEWPAAITISGTGSLVKRGTGTLTLNPTHTHYSGTVTVETDTLKIEDWRDSNTGVQISPITVKNGAVLELAGSRNLYHNFPLTLEEGSTLVKSNTGGFDEFSSHDVTVTGAVKIEITNSPTGTTGDEQLYIRGLRGSGTLTLDNTGGNEHTGLTIADTGPDHFNDTLVVKGGRLGIGNSSSTSGAGLALDSTSIRLENGAKFLLSEVARVTPVDVSVKSLHGADGTEVQLGAQTLTLGTDNGKSNYGGVIIGSGGLKKVGTDTAVLSGVNTYTGPTRVEKGVLEIGNEGSLASASTVTIAGATLRGKGTVKGSVTLTGSAGSTLYGGSGSGNADTLTIEGRLVGERGGLDVYASGSGSSLKTSLVEAEEATGHVVVNLRQAISGASQAITRTIIKCTNGTFSMNPKIGVNLSTLSARLFWTSGVGLRLELGAASGLYRNNVLLTSEAIHSANIALNENSIFTESVGTPNVTHELSGIISGPHDVETQVDSLILTGENTYTGTTTVSTGVLQIGKAGSGNGKLGTGAVILSSANSELLYKHGGNAHAVANAISGAGKLTQAGTDTLILSGANTYRGPTRVKQGVLRVIGSLSNSPVTVDGGKLLGTGTVPSVTLTSTAGSALSGGNGPGHADTLKISGALRGVEGSKLEVYSSGSSVSVVTADEASGNLTVDLKEAITVTSSPPVTLTLIKCARRTSSMEVKIGVNDSEQGARVIWTSGEGLQVILGSRVGLYKDSELLTAGATHSENIVLTDDVIFTEVVGTTRITHELSGVISGEYGIENRVDTLILTGNNSYTGTTLVSSGVLQIGKEGSGNGKLGPGPVNLVVTGSELLYKHGGNRHIVANAISGAGKLTQAGTDTLILTGANTYTGPTKVSSGVLRVTGSLSSSAVTVSGGALCGTDTVKSVILSNTAGSVIYGGNGADNADTLHIKEALTLTGSGGALNVYSSVSGSTAKPSHVKAGSVSGNLVVNIEGALPAGTYVLISCTDAGSSLTPTLGRNSSGFCVALSWETGVGLKVEVGVTSTISATVAASGTPANQNATTKPRVTFTGSGGVAPYTFTYKIGQGAEQTATGTGTSSTAEVEASTETAGSFEYNLIKVLDSKGCSKSISGQQATVVINKEITGDLPKPGESLHVYPVPAQDQIVIRSSQVLGRVQLRDMQGRVLLEREPSSSREVELSIADLPPGIYMVEVEEGQNLRRVKLSKE